MHKISSSDELCMLFSESTCVTLTHNEQFVFILRDGERSIVFKNIQGRLTGECFPDMSAWAGSVPMINKLTILIEKHGKGDKQTWIYRVLIRFKVADGSEQVWLVGEDKALHVTQVFLAYENPEIKSIETLVIVEGYDKKPQSCGSLSFNKEGRKTLNIYVKVIKALMGLSDIMLTPLLDGKMPEQIPGGSEYTADDERHRYGQ